MVHDCMVYTELAPRWLQFHVAPAMPALKYTTSVDIQKTHYKKLVTHVEPQASAVKYEKVEMGSLIHIVMLFARPSHRRKMGLKESV